MTDVVAVGAEINGLSVESDDSVLIVAQVNGTAEMVLYGELIVLGYNGKSGVERKHQSKMRLCRRRTANGISKSHATDVYGAPKDSQSVQDSTRHTVSYTCGRNRTVVVEYKPDSQTDLFQIGRSSEPQIDFTVVDTNLLAGQVLPQSASAPLSKMGVAAKQKRAEEKAPCSTISRYACRLLVDRSPPYTVRLFAAGFDVASNIFLGEKATKWKKRSGEMDGLTTNGILLLHPSAAAHDGMYEWREVSVDGDMFTARETRSAPRRGDLVERDTNELQDGSLVDLCGATLLWRSAAGLQRAPTPFALDSRLDELNQGRPQCPVSLNTLVVPRRRGLALRHDDKQPYAYMGCGHVQGLHSWGHLADAAGGRTAHRCPMCQVESDGVLSLSMGLEPAFHLDADLLSFAFNPCGHMASAATVQYWSRIPLPHGTNSYHPVCPFCTCMLATEKPFVKLHFQDHCDS